MMTDPAQRIVITGMGFVSPLGSDLNGFWASLKNRESGVRPLQSLPASNLPTPFGGEAVHFTGDISNYGPLDKNLTRAIRKNGKVMCREIEMGVAAAQLALYDGKFEQGKHNPDRTGVVFGSDYILTLPQEYVKGVKKCLNEQGHFEFSEWAEKGMSEVEPLWLLKYLPNMPASHIAIYNDLRGPSNSITLREASSNLSIAEAYATLQRGSADMMVVGATGTRVHPLRTLHVVLQEQVAGGEGNPAEASRPFDLNRQGMVLAEGAGAIIMETLESAQKRNAKIYAEVIGHSSSCVVSRQGVPDYRTAIENVLRGCLRSSGLSTESVGHINAHGIGTTICDRDEAQAIQAVFGQRQVPVAALKSFFGNMGAAAGTVELIASVLALQNNELFPTVNFDTPDPECPINVVSKSGVSPGDNFISVNVTPQGQAGAVVVSKFVA